MKDVQSEKDIRKIPLKKVGIKNLKWPITVMDNNHGFQNAVGTFDLSVDLPHDVRGTHMSRFVEVVNDLTEISPKGFKIMMENLRNKLEADTAHCRVEFDYFVKKSSPISGIVAPYDVKCCYEAEKGEDEVQFIMDVAVPVTTLCPCSKEISEFGAHNQRAIIHIKVKTLKLIWIEELVQIAEDSASSPVFSLLKRKDEKYVTEQAYLKPRFVEDVTREVAVRLKNLNGITWYSAYVESEESIHNHNAFAYTEEEL